MARYFARSRHFIEDDLFESQWDRPRVHVDVPNHEPTFTGLLDVNEDPIMRDPRPIGFGRDDEW